MNPKTISFIDPASFIAAATTAFFDSKNLHLQNSIPTFEKRYEGEYEVYNIHMDYTTGRTYILTTFY